MKNILTEKIFPIKKCWVSKKVRGSTKNTSHMTDNYKIMKKWGARKMVVFYVEFNFLSKHCIFRPVLAILTELRPFLWSTPFSLQKYTIFCSIKPPWVTDSFGFMQILVFQQKKSSFSLKKVCLSKLLVQWATRGAILTLMTPESRKNRLEVVKVLTSPPRNFCLLQNFASNHFQCGQSVDLGQKKWMKK